MRTPPSSPTLPTRKPPKPLPGIPTSTEVDQVSTGPTAPLEGQCLCGEPHRTGKHHKPPRGTTNHLDGLLICRRCHNPIP